MTFLRCVPDVLAFSDLKGTLGSHKLDNVLSDKTEKSTLGVPDFDLYFKQREYLESGREIELGNLGNIPIPYKDWRSAGKNAAWGLDKYKFLPMIKHAWDQQPNKDWYVFIEQDTYLSISNLVRFLNTQDPKEKLYFGNAIRMWEHPTPLKFAHGGSGFILSGATVDAFAAAYQAIDEKFTPRRISQWFYGDFVVADALDEELHVHVTDATPMVNSEHPALLPFGEAVWCKPVITLHHMDARQFDEMYKFQRDRNFSELLFRDVYTATYTAGMPVVGESWDNVSDDDRFTLEVKPNDPSRMEDTPDIQDLLEPSKSHKACGMACEQNEKCFQYMHSIRMLRRDDGTLAATPECHLSKVFRLGKQFRAEEHERGAQRTSGWRSDRIKKWIVEHQDCPNVNFGVP
jgi:hypothetical protein